MKRSPEPCGTRAAAARHERRNEPLCTACKEAKNEYAKTLRAVRKPAREISLNKEWREMDAALEANPPVIQWRKNNRGVFVAVSIDDPHAETRTERNRDREWAERIAREEAALASMEAEARRVAERFERHRADNTPLMAAARREI